MSENITPAYREEKLLANIAGGDYDITPATRKEKLLAEIQGLLSEIEGLPDTTGATAGDVLTIGSDGPEWAAPAGGGGLVVGGTWSVVDGAPYLTLNKTALELRTAVYAGISPILVVEVDENVSDSYQIIANFGTMRYVGGADYSFSIGFGFEYYVASADNAYPHTQLSG